MQDDEKPMKAFSVVFALTLAVFPGPLRAQSTLLPATQDREHTLSIPTCHGSDTGLGRRTIGHFDITFCAKTLSSGASNNCKVADPTYTFHLPSNIKGEIQDFWYNVISAANGIRGDNRADLQNARTIIVTYTPTLADQEETFRIYFMMIQ
jgi:hypothetical protein